MKGYLHSKDETIFLTKKRLRDSDEKHSKSDLDGKRRRREWVEKLFPNFKEKLQKKTKQNISLL